MPVGDGKVVGLRGGRRDIRHGYYLGALYRLYGKLGEQQRDFGRREHVIHLHVFDGAPGHSLIQRGVQGLSDSHPGVLLDREKPRRAVVEIARKNDSNDPWPVTMGCGPKEGIEGRPVTIFFGAPGQPSLTIAEMQVTIGRGYVNLAGLDRLATDDMASRQWTGPAQNPGQGAGDGSWEVDHDKN